MAALEERPTSLDQFREALERHGIVIEANVRGGKVTGRTYAVGLEKMKGSDLGRAFTTKRITEQL